MTIKRSGFIGCCGIQILCNFGNTGILGFNDAISVRTLDKKISDILLKAVREDWEPAGYRPSKPIPKAMTLIALNQTQHDKLHKLMLKKGFKLVDQGWNLDHKDMNYLYSLHLEKGQKEYDLK